MKKTMTKIRIPFQIVISLTVLAILIIELIRPFTNFPTGGFGPKNPQGTPFEIWSPFAADFAYFTIWTNIIIVFTLFVAWVMRAKVNPYWRNAVATYAMVILVVFFTLIIPYMDWTASWWLITIRIWQHLGIVLIALWWFFSTKTETKTHLGQSTLITLMIPLGYFIFTTIIYFILNVAPYNFLDFKNAFKANLALPLSIAMSSLTIVVILLLFIGFNWLFVMANNHKALSVKRGKKGAVGSENAKQKRHKTAKKAAATRAKNKPNNVTIVVKSSSANKPRSVKKKGKPKSKK